MSFNANRTKDALIKWIKEQFENNGGDTAVVGISGGKDSSIVAALCAEALDKDCVLGVLMPCGEQSDIADSLKLVNHLGIPNVTVNIAESVWHLRDQVATAFNGGEGGANDPYTNGFDAATVKFMRRFAADKSPVRLVTDCEMLKVNAPARIRMATLYAVAATCNGRVANTCNLSEDYVGYATKFGDAAGDFSPLSQLTVTEVRAIGHALGLPTELVDKTPTDGLCGMTDEESLGMPYSVIDDYIRTGRVVDMAVKCEIEIKHERNLHKLLPMPYFQPDHAKTVREIGDIPSNLK